MNEKSSVENAVIDENILELINTFGAYDLPDEYLLVDPQKFDVNQLGDIYIGDENKIKVFDGQGNPKEIVGSQGQGPEEFEHINSLSIGPYGYITVLGSVFISLISPNHEFIRKNNFSNSSWLKEFVDKYGLHNVRAKDVITYDSNDQIFYIYGEKDRGSKPPQGYNYLVHLKNGELHLISEVKEKHVFTKVINAGRFSTASNSFPYLGKFHWAYCSNNRLVYCDAGSNLTDIGGDPLYVLKIYNTISNKVTEISHRYEKMLIGPEELKEVDPEYKYNKNYPELRSYYNSLRKDLLDIKYKDSLRSIKVDRNYVFAFTYKTNSDGMIYTDVFDIDKNKFLKSVYFPFIPKVIINGFAYKAGKNEEGYRVMERYKLTDAVY